MKSNSLTVISIATCATVGTVLFHESIHAVTCWWVGSVIEDFSALHVNCPCDDGTSARIVAGSASIANLALAALLWPLLRRTTKRNGDIIYFVWLCFLFNLLSGTGYWVISGVANFGDWAIVVEGLKPMWIYRVGLSILGVVTFMAAVAVALGEFGRIVGGTANEMFGRAQRMASTSYVAAVCSIAVIGLFHPAGFVSPPVLAGIIAVAGAYSPLLWMMQWFRADLFAKQAGDPLTFHWSVWWAGLAIACLLSAIAATWFGMAAQ